jgi:5-methylcytosine-specific restriction endonuclease McrA
MKMLRRTDSGALCFNSAPSIELAQLHNVVGKAPFTMGGLTVPAVRLSNDGDHCEGRFAMSAKDGNPCKKCGGTEWYKGGKCVACAKQASRRWRTENPERYKELNRRWCTDNAERKRENDKRWHSANREKTRKAWRDFKARNPEAIKESRRKYYLKNVDKTNLNARRWQLENHEKARQADRQWKSKNPEKLKIHNHNRRARIIGNGGTYTVAEWQQLCAQYGNRCIACGAVGVKLTADHVVPLALGGSNGISNIQPLCMACNLSKGARTVDYRTHNQTQEVQPRLIDTDD